MKEDLISIINDMEEVWNDHDIVRALEFFSDEAIVRVDAAPHELIGKDDIRMWIEQSFADNVHVGNFRNMEVDGDTISWDAQLHMDSVAKAGLDPICPRVRAVFKDGKIVRFLTVLDEESKRIVSQTLGVHSAELC